MREQLENGNLQTLTIPKDAVIWMDDHEILVNNMMFDIKTSKLENNVYTFTGLYDAAETELIEEAEGIRKGTEDDDHLVSLINLINSQFKNPNKDAGFISFESRKFYAPHSSDLSSLLRTVDTPPPRI
ncbi:MAG: hypothetical protein H7Y27_04870 [Gemmatimonadaceae bacterium]|nr:hypothetical protein [Chitinophagaceae bacterium]